jgi:hypothetical protein
MSVFAVFRAAASFTDDCDVLVIGAAASHDLTAARLTA